MFPPGQQPGSSGSKGNQTSIYQSPFAAHPRSNNLASSAKGSAASLLNGMPALPMASQPMNVSFLPYILASDLALAGPGGFQTPTFPVHFSGSFAVTMLTITVA